MDLFIKIDTGTDYQDKRRLNPLFILLAKATEVNVEAVAKLFNLTKRR